MTVHTTDDFRKLMTRFGIKQIDRPYKDCTKMDPDAAACFWGVDWHSRVFINVPVVTQSRGARVEYRAMTEAFILHQDSPDSNIGFRLNQETNVMAGLRGAPPLHQRLALTAPIDYADTGCHPDVDADGFSEPVYTAGVCSDLGRLAALLAGLPLRFFGDIVYDDDWLNITLFQSPGV